MIAKLSENERAKIERAQADKERRKNLVKAHATADHFLWTIEHYLKDIIVIECEKCDWLITIFKRKALSQYGHKTSLVSLIHRLEEEGKFPNCEENLSIIHDYCHTDFTVTRDEMPDNTIWSKRAKDAYVDLAPKPLRGFISFVGWLLVMTFICLLGYWLNP